MAPTKEKPKHVYVAPEWIDQKFVKTLSKEKQAYWANRVLGKVGQGEPKNLTKVFKTPENITIGFDNNGQMVAKTREMRRQKLPADNTKTKKQLVPKRKR